MTVGNVKHDVAAKLNRKADTMMEGALKAQRMLSRSSLSREIIAVVETLIDAIIENATELRSFARELLN